MPANTSPDNITYPVGTDQDANLDTWFQTLATSTQTALNTRAVRTYKTADLASLALISGMTNGDLAFVIEGGAVFEYIGTGWTQITQARFSSAAARNTAYAKASGAFLVPGAVVFRTDSGNTETYYSAGRYHPTLAGWYYPGQAIQATVAAGWTGDIVWGRVGNTVTVNLGLTRTGASLTQTRWTYSVLGTQVPLPFNTNMWAGGLGFTNQTNELSWAVSASANEIHLDARWQEYVFGSGGWLEASFSYISATSG